jgi:SAM-dependent methyltransferase
MSIRALSAIGWEKISRWYLEELGIQQREMRQRAISHDSYQEIFELRADTYHAAMSLYPTARSAEFEAIVNFSDLQPGTTIADIPSGGGYLGGYINDPSARLIAVEPTKEFFSRCQESQQLEKVLSPLEKIDIAAESVDAVVSLAGLHHVSDRQSVFGELRRILVPGGTLCIADVQCGSSVDLFLNTFVNEHNSLGHTGWFIDADFKQTIVKAGFDLEQNQVLRYSWDFPHIDAMVEFCTLLFGLDTATPEIVHAGIQQYLGYSTEHGSCQMSWELEFLRCKKLASPAKTDPD